MFGFDLWFVFLVFIGGILGLTALIICIEKYEYAVILAALSPWFSAAFARESSAILTSDDPTIGSYIRIAILFLVGAAGLIRVLKRKELKLGSIPIQLLLMACFTLWAFLSVKYSIDQRFTLIRSATFFALFCFLLGLYNWLQESNQVEKMLNALAIVMIFFIVTNLVSMVVLPGKAWYFASGRCRGLWAQPNSLGSVSMVSYPVLLWKFQRSELRNRAIIGGLIAACGIMHILSGSRGSLAASLIGITVWFIVQKKSVKLIVFGTFIMIIMAVVLEYSMSRFERSYGADNMTTLTGRTEFWEAAFVLISERPFNGYGYMVEGKVWSDPRFYRDEIVLWIGSARTSLHNGYISIAISFGLVALPFWLVLLVLPYFRCFRIPTSEYKAYTLATMTMALTINFIETIITGQGSMTAIAFWIAWVTAAYLYQADQKSLDNIIQLPQKDEGKTSK